MQGKGKQKEQCVPTSNDIVFHCHKDTKRLNFTPTT